MRLVPQEKEPATNGAPAGQAPAKANNERGTAAEREGDRAKTAQLLQEAVQKLWVDEVDALCEHFGAGWMGGCTTRSRLNYGVNK